MGRVGLKFEGISTGRIGSIVSVVLVGLLAMPAFAAEAPVAQIDQAAMDRAFQRLGSEFIQASRADGLSIAVVANGRARFYNFGSVSRDKPRTPTESTVYEIGSISKVFTSLLLAHAAIEKKIDLHDDVRRYLPGEYPNLAFQDTPVRLIDLVNTTSALPENLPDGAKIAGNAGPDEAPFLIVQALKRYSDATLLEDLRSQALVDRPGATPRHSNLAAKLAGIVVEKAYGDSYENLLARYIERPFGMASGTDLSRSASFATGYNERHLAMPALDMRTLFPVGGLRYSAADMAGFLIAELAASDASIRLSQQPAWGSVDNMAVAFNWTLDRTVDSKLRLRASGGTFGFSSHIEMYPELGYGVVLLANRPGEAQNQLQDLASQAMRDIRGKPAALAALEVALEKGDYRDVGKIVAKVRRRHPELHLTEDFLNQWGGRLLDGSPKRAVGLFAYNAARWPNSWNAFDSLAEAYKRSGDTKRAIANYRRSLELNAGNAYAADELKKLEKAEE